MKIRAHVYISGRVQGVFFRSETRQKAHRHNVTGWIRNLPDRRVETILEGEKEDVEKLVEFCKKGPAGAKVTRVEVMVEAYSGEFDNFLIS
jgi:acylphosphatase